MSDVIKFLTENWETIAAVIGGPMGVLAVLGMIAEWTPWEWDNTAIKAIREFWAKIPIFTRDAKKMGTGPGSG